MLRRSLGVGLGSLLWARHALAAAQQNGNAVVAAAPLPPPAALGDLGIAPNVILLAGGAAIGSYTKLIDDMATLFHVFAPEFLRILPVITSGGLEQVYYATRVDALHGGLMSGIVLDVVRRDGWLPDLTERLNYICRLYLEEVHIVCKDGFKSIFDLNGRKVNTGPLNSGTEIIARRMFELLDIHPTYDHRPTATALRGLPQGDPEAVVFVAGKPVTSLQSLEAAGNLRLLNVPWRIGTATRLADSDFQQTVLQHDDYPNLIPPDGKVTTLGSPVYLMTANAPAKSVKQQNVSAFATMFLQNLSVLQRESGLKKWRDADLLARLPHFHRAPEVAAWFTDAPAKPPPQGVMLNN